MSRPLGLILYALAMVAIIVGVDIMFFRQHFWPRLMVNVGIVLVFMAFLHPVLQGRLRATRIFCLLSGQDLTCSVNRAEDPTVIAAYWRADVPQIASWLAARLHTA